MATVTTAPTYTASTATATATSTGTAAATATATATGTGTKTGTKTGTAAAVRHRWRQAWPGYAAAGAALAYAAPHFWWGAGIGATFPGDFATAPHGTWEAAIGYWVMGAVAVFGAVVALALVRPWGRRLTRRTLCAVSLTASVGMTLWGFTYFALQYLLAAGRVVSAPDFAAKDAHPQAAWGLFWYGLFVLWGLMLGLAARNRLRRSA